MFANKPTLSVSIGHLNKPKTVVTSASFTKLTCQSINDLRSLI